MYRYIKNIKTVELKHFYHIKTIIERHLNLGTSYKKNKGEAKKQLQYVY